MVLSVQQKAEIVNKYGLKPGDTGSPEVQIALMTARIEDLSAHFKTHVHDHHSRQGLVRLINKRRKLLDYLKKRDPDRYRRLISELGLRR